MPAQHTLGAVCTGFLEEHCRQLWKVSAQTDLYEGCVHNAR